MIQALEPLMQQLPSDAERVSALKALPMPPEAKISMGLVMLSPEADAFKLLKPLSKDMDSLSRELFKSFANMSDSKIEAEIKEDQKARREEGQTITPEKDLLLKSPNERRRGFCAAVLVGSKLLRDEADSDDEFGDPWGGEDSDDDSDSDSDDEEEDLAALPPTVRKYKEVLASLEKSDARIIFLEQPFDEEKDQPKDVTAKKLLAVDHLMLPRTTADTARGISKRARKLVCNWMGGGTSCGNAVWARFLRPALEDAEEDLARGDHASALGPLLGVLLFGLFDDGWLMDQEEYCEWDSFEGWFSGLSAAWQAVLAQSDKDLGLEPPRGRKEAGHYRKRLMEMLSRWEKDVNEHLDDLNDNAEGGKKAKLTATKKGKAAPKPKGKAKAKAAAGSSQPSSSSSSGKRRRGQ